MSGSQLPQAAGTFNPNDSIYRSCCCHTKTFTIVTGILEIFTICFILVAIIPDVNSRLCEAKFSNGTYIYPELANKSITIDRNVSHSSNYSTATPVVTDRNSSASYQANMYELRQFVCDMNIGWLVGSILDIISINIMFYAIKSVRWLLFIPHLIFRIVIIMFFVLGITLEVYSIVDGGANPSSTAIAEIRCAHFIKRSQETGYSISVARPIGPATISVSEQQQIQQPARQLPPLRHTYGNPAQKYAE